MTNYDSSKSERNNPRTTKYVTDHKETTQLITLTNNYIRTLNKRYNNNV